MDGKESVFEEERQHVQEVRAMIEASLDRAERLVKDVDGVYEDTKRYLVSNRGEIAPEEMLHSHLELLAVDQRVGIAQASKEKLAKLLDSPYFARVDFAPEDAGDVSKSYIGRFAFSYGNASIISDWRSPVAGLFYDFELGEAFYEAPKGLVKGAIVGKRQFKIEDGELVYAVDSASSVRDEVLQMELSRTSDQKMRSIISSIQREQNLIIRDERAGTLIIQGVAGSGKTSIALHRIAYLLYRQKERLSSKSIVILSPNKVFGDYISNVLPELGEEPVGERSLYDVASDLLKDVVRIQKPRSFVDDPDDSWRKRARRKTTRGFAESIQRYLEHVGDDLFQGVDVTFGQHVMKGAWLEERYRAYGNLCIDERLDLLASDAMAELNAQSYGRSRLSLPPKKEVRKRLDALLKAKGPLALYQLFLEETGEADLFRSPGKNQVEWEDAYPLVLFRAAYFGFEEYSDVKHLVVDEMQDLTPVQHEVIARLFPCDKTILGDCFQMVDDRDGLLLDEVASFYPAARTAKLLRSYRSTFEIVELARRVKPVAGMEAVARHGEEPRVIACGDTADVLRRIGLLVESFAASGRKTLGILHKSEELASRYAALLARDFDVHLVTEDTATFSAGITVASVKMAKGLEFDEVVVLDADARQYATEADRNLLYVAVTRAMHKLAVLHRGEVTRFLA